MGLTTSTTVAEEQPAPSELATEERLERLEKTVSDFFYSTEERLERLEKTVSDLIKDYNNLKISPSLGDQPSEEGISLQEKVASLEKKLNDLRKDYEMHRHVYGVPTRPRLNEGDASHTSYPQTVLNYETAEGYSDMYP